MNEKLKEMATGSAIYLWRIHSTSFIIITCNGLIGVSAIKCCHGYNHLKLTFWNLCFYFNSSYLILEVIYICHLIPQETYFSLMQIKSTCDRLSQQYVLDHEDKVISLNPSCP